MDESITKFIKKQTCANICCVDEKGSPYCFTCFYSFNSNEGLIFIKSPLDTHHSKLIFDNPNIAGTILPDKLNVLKVMGIQFEGIVLSQDHLLSKNASSHYHKKYPFALAMPGEIWTVQVNKIKMTDSRLGLGKKLTWSRE